MGSLKIKFLKGTRYNYRLTHNKRQLQAILAIPSSLFYRHLTLLFPLIVAIQFQMSLSSNITRRIRGITCLTNSLFCFILRHHVPFIYSIMVLVFHPCTHVQLFNKVKQKCSNGGRRICILLMEQTACFPYCLLGIWNVANIFIEQFCKVPRCLRSECRKNFN